MINPNEQIQNFKKPSINFFHSPSNKRMNPYGSYTMHSTRNIQIPTKRYNQQPTTLSRKSSQATFLIQQGKKINYNRYEGQSFYNQSKTLQTQPSLREIKCSVTHSPNRSFNSTQKVKTFQPPRQSIYNALSPQQMVRQSSVNSRQSSLIPESIKYNKASTVITNDPRYIGSMKIYNTGIKEDPVPGEKRGKALNSSFWVSDLAVFIEQELTKMQKMVECAQKQGQIQPGADYLMFVDMANQMFMKAENAGLQTEKSKQQWLMASWLVMCAAEVDNYNYSKYSKEDRLKQKNDFYYKYLNAIPMNSEFYLKQEEMGIFYVKPSRMDMIPQTALERLGIHNELCAVKWGEKQSQKWKIEGFPISMRISSAKRHFDGVHQKDLSEDHISHLLWNFMAIYHVIMTQNHQNDLVNFEEIQLLSADKKSKQLFYSASKPQDSQAQSMEIIQENSSQKD